MPYDPSKIERRWQDWWEDDQTFAAKDDDSLPKFYALDMFPYPSGEGLHVGHAASYIAGDVVSRKRRAQGFNVLHPMGYDAFGLPAEQAPIDEGAPPQQRTAEAIENLRRQLVRCGFSYDWSREVSTADPSYYKWTQWIFTRLYEAGLAYEDDDYVNWCPALGTALATEEVIDGKSERGGHPVERIRRKQWNLRITAFAEDLLEALEIIDWPSTTKAGQRERIGRSEGASILFDVVGHDEKLEVFTTRPHTVWGATYLVMAPEHPMVERIVTAEARAAVEAYQRRAASMSEINRQASKERTGVDIGARATNPATGEQIPIWIADHVIFGYGTGAIMAVPAHDQRDWEFAKAMDLEIREVVSGGNVEEEAHAGEGTLVNSGPLDGTETANEVALRAAVDWLEARGCGSARITYELRDWTFARQRYWGEPIPILEDEAGEVVRPLTVEELPLELPLVEDYAPTATGESPLSRAKDWLRVEEGGRTLLRETDTMSGSAGSSWCFLRCCDPHNEAELCSREASDYWMPVDLYVGGPEHTAGHLMYARMWQRFLYDEGLVRDPEPFMKLRHQGMITAFTHYDQSERVVPWSEVEERDGKYVRKADGEVLTSKLEKMSERKGNVVDPDEVIREFGADAMRVYICFLGPLDQDKPWAPSGVKAQFDFLERFWRLFFGAEDEAKATDSEPSEDALEVVHEAIAKVSEGIERLALHTAISALHAATRDLTQLGETSRAVLEPLCQLIAPFAPHIAEQIWAEGLGHTDGISYAAWPEAGVQLTGET